MLAVLRLLSGLLRLIGEENEAGSSQGSDGIKKQARVTGHRTYNSRIAVPASKKQSSSTKSSHHDPVPRAGSCSEFR